MAAPNYKAILYRAGFRGKALDTAYAVMMAESGGRPDAHNPDASTGDNSYGLFQINMLGALGPDRLKRYGLKSNEDLFDPVKNARVAFQMSKGGKDWSPWSAYKNGSYQKYLGKMPTTSASSPVASNGAPGAPGAMPGVPKQTMMTLNQIFAKVGLPAIAGIGETKIGRRQPMPAPVVPGASAAPTVKGKAVPMPKVQRMVSLIEYAQSLGLSVRENPYTDPVQASSHVKGSHHVQTIGKYKSKKVGRAIDVSGEPAKMKAFFSYAEQFRGQGLDDLFYDPMGYSYDQGRRWDKTIGGHGDHVHLSVR